MLATASADEISTHVLAGAGVFEIVRRPLISTEIAVALIGLAVPKIAIGRLQK